MNTLAGLFQSLGQVNTGATVLDISLTALISVLTGVLHDASGWQSIFVVWMAVSVAGAALGMLSGLAARKKV